MLGGLGQHVVSRRALRWATSCGRPHSAASPMGPRLSAAPNVIGPLEVRGGPADRSRRTVTRRYSSGLLNFAVHSPEDCQRDRRCRYACLQRTGPEGTVPVQNGGSSLRRGTGASLQRGIGIRGFRHLRPAAFTARRSLSRPARLLPGSACNIGGDNIGGVPVQAPASPVVPHRGARISM
jgi:hypothetical protein